MAGLVMPPMKKGAAPAKGKATTKKKAAPKAGKKAAAPASGKDKFAAMRDSLKSMK